MKVRFLNRHRRLSRFVIWRRGLVSLNHELKAYKRIHKFSHPSDVEKGKIGRETSLYIKLKGKSDTICRQLAGRPDVPDDLLDQLGELDTAAGKVRKNAKGHKERLKRLSGHKGFE